MAALKAVATITVVIAGVAGSLWSETAVSFAEEPPTFQRRYAPKEGSSYVHLVGTTHIRNDFYNSHGIGVDVGYYPSEAWGLEAQVLGLRTRLSSAARGIKEQTGLTPDARPQQLIATAGLRLSFGYGKFLLPRGLLIHIDPQVALHSGLAIADRRILPTTLLAPSLLLHLKWGLQVRIDLNLSYQLEQRERGWVSSFGFLPTIGLGIAGRPR